MIGVGLDAAKVRNRTARKQQAAGAGTAPIQRVALNADAPPVDMNEVRLDILSNFGWA